MTYLSNGEKTIRYSIGDVVAKTDNDKDHTLIYEVTSPNITCTDKKDAIYIQELLNTFTAEITRHLIM